MKKILLLFVLGFLSLQASAQFITTWETTAPGETITIPTTGGTYDYTVNWGDGSTSVNRTTNSTHAYATPGIHTVSISGLFPRIYFNNTAESRLKIKSIEQWGTNPWTSMNGAFSGAENMVSNATDMPNLSGVSDMYGMFAFARKFNGDLQFPNWDVSNVTNMYGMFAGASIFNQRIRDWDVSNVTTMENMFNGATLFKRYIGDWDVSSVTNMKNMFRAAFGFDQDLSGWDVSNVTDMTDMFKFVTLSTANYDSLLIGWNSLSLQSNVTFSGGNSAYCTGQAARSNMISSLGWNITDGGRLCDAGTLFITTWKTTTPNEKITIPTTGGGYLYGVNWNYDPNVAGSWSTLVTGNATHTYATPGVHTIAIRGTFPRIFFNNTGDRLKIQSVEQWGANQWTSMNGAFAGTENMVSNAIDTPDFSNVTDMYGAFAFARKFNGDLHMGDWDVSNVTNMYGMFGGASVFNHNINTWDVGNVTNMEEMFHGATVFNQPLNDWDVSKVTSMRKMFFAALAFDQDLGDWNVSNVTNMTGMLSSVKLSTPNYDSLLIGWDALSLQNNINFDGGLSMYCLGEDARENIIDTDFWTISDGGRNCINPCGNITTYSAGSWSNGFPTSSNKAVFASNYVTGSNGGSIDACAVVIKSGVTVTVSAGNTIRAEYNLDVHNNGKLIFESTSTGDGELGILGPDAVISGKATVQRYMSANESFRMVSPSVTTSTSIMANWQEGVHNTSVDYVNNLNPNPGFGTHITGSTMGASGFDATVTGNPSLFTEDISNQVFTPVSNTDVNTLSAGDPYLLYIRGDRSVNLFDTNPPATETVIRTTGVLAYGPQPQGYASPSTGAFVMFGNPYQSAVDVTEVFATSTNVNTNYYYVLDPTYGTYGAYITVDLNGGANVPASDADQFLQPGQAAQLITNGPGSVVVDFQEAYKAPGNFTATNRPSALSLNNVLVGELYTETNYNNAGSIHDSFMLNFAENNSNELTSIDAMKPMNFYENLGINHNGTVLSIEKRALPQSGDNYPLFTSGYQTTNYVLKMDRNGLEDVNVYLDDKFTGESTLLDQGTIAYSFNVDATDSQSRASDRFVIRVGERLDMNGNTSISGITLYPNPMGSQLNLANPNNEKLDSASIYDLTGRMIKTFDLKGVTSEMTLDVSSLSVATYMVVINSEAGQVSKLMVKQ